MGNRKIYKNTAVTIIWYGVQPYPQVCLDNFWKFLAKCNFQKPDKNWVS